METKRKVQLKVNYVDPKKLSDEIRKYQNNPNDPPSDELGEMIIKIANRFFSARNWSGYTYRNEMVADGIHRIIKFLHNIDPDKNPFSYMSTILYHVGLNKIKSEKRQTETKKKYAELLFEEYENQEGINLNHDSNIEELT